jgi:hypothetical protein
LANGQWKIKGEVKNTLKPQLNLDVEMHSGIQEVVDFLKWDSLLKSKGQLDFKANILGKWNPEDSVWRWEDWKAEGNVSIKADEFQWQFCTNVWPNIKIPILISRVSGIKL